jgi:hypothetical protein
MCDGENEVIDYEGQMTMSTGVTGYLMDKKRMAVNGQSNDRFFRSQ